MAWGQRGPGPGGAVRGGVGAGLLFLRPARGTPGLGLARPVPGHPREPSPRALPRFLLPPPPGCLPGPSSRSRSLPPLPSPAAASSSSSSLSLSICLSRSGIHSGPGAGAARPPSAHRWPSGVRPRRVRPSARAPARRPGERPRPSAGPGRAGGGPRPSPPAPIAGPRALGRCPLPPRAGPRSRGAGRRTGTCPARPFVVMPRGAGAGRGRRGPGRAGTPSARPPLPGREEQASRLSPRARSRPNLSQSAPPVATAAQPRAPSPRP